MRHMLKRTYMILLALLAILPSAARSDNDKWSLEISLDKQTYVLHEQIWLDLAKANITSDVLHTFPLSLIPNNAVFAIEIRDQDGTLMEFTGPSYTPMTIPGKPKPLRLEPGEQDRGCTNLAWRYGVPHWNTDFSVLYPYFSHFGVGRYSVRARHDGAISNELHFSVVLPEGDEERVFRLIERATQAERDDDRVTSARIFRDIVERFPESVFAPQCYYLSMWFNPDWRRTSRGGLKGRKELNTEMLEKYPDYGESVDWLFSVTHDMEDGKQLKLFDSLVVRAPGTRAARFALQMRRKLLREMSDNGWSLEISLDKESYVLHEPIWLDMTLTNLTSDTMRTTALSALHEFDKAVDLRNSDGTAVEYTGHIPLVAYGPGILFEAGGQRYGCWNLQLKYGLRPGNSEYSVIGFRFPTMPRGTYTVQVELEGLVSNELSFTIVEPSGAEREALLQIENASAMSTQDTDMASQTFDDVVDRFPGSAFAEKCYYLSRYYSPEIQAAIQRNTFDERVIHREMLQKYPNSGRSIGWVRSAVKGLEDSEKLAFLDSLSERNRGTRAAKFANQMRNRLLKQKEGE